MAILSVSTIRASFNSKSSRTAVPYVNRLLSGTGASWIASGLFDEDFQTSTDYEYWQRIAVHGGLIVRLNKFLACSREHLATVTKSQRAKVAARLSTGIGEELPAARRALALGALHFRGEFFARHRDIDAIYAGRMLIDEHHREVALWVLPPHNPAVARHIDPVLQETLFWRASILERVGGLDPSFRCEWIGDLILRFQKSRQPDRVSALFSPPFPSPFAAEDFDANGNSRRRGVGVSADLRERSSLAIRRTPAL